VPGKRVVLSDSPEQPPAWQADLVHPRPLPTEPLSGWRASLTRAELFGLVVAGLSIVVALVGLALTHELGGAGSVVPVVSLPGAEPTPGSTAGARVPAASPSADGTAVSGSLAGREQSAGTAARSSRTAAAPPRVATGTTAATPRATPSRPSGAVASLTPSPTPSTGAAEVYYRNCVQVQAEHPAPLLRGQPGYRDALDKDGDGIACNERGR